MSNVVSDTELARNKRLRLLINVISIGLPLLVAIMFRFKFENVQWPFDVYLLPLTNAIINGASAVLLIVSLVAIKNRNVVLHTRLIYVAMGLSLLFLLIYVMYHTTTTHTSYGGEGGIRTFYLILLASHIILAAIQPPFVLYAFYYGYTGQYDKHLKLVKFSFPIWLYVSVTGVICYLMISPYYPA